jgi:hypothetical protein
MDYKTLRNTPENSYLLAKASFNGKPNGSEAIGTLKFRGQDIIFKKICGFGCAKQWNIMYYENYFVISEEEAFLKMLEIL